MNKASIYISGPITGDKNFAEHFAGAEKALVMEGHKVYNPAKLHLVMPRETTHEEYMSICLKMMEQCDTVLMLTGWQESTGASIEFEYAYEHGYTIGFEGGKRIVKSQRNAVIHKEDKGADKAKRWNVPFLQGALSHAQHNAARISN